MATIMPWAPSGTEYSVRPDVLIAQWGDGREAIYLHGDLKTGFPGRHLRWLLKDTKLTHPLWENRSADGGIEQIAPYFEAVLSAVEQADRQKLNGVIANRRMQTLTDLGIPPELIGSLEFPEPKVKW